MTPFTYSRAGNGADALARLGVDSGSARADGSGRFIAGGTNLLDLMKENVLRPARLVDINGLPGLDTIETTPEGGLRLGALARNADTAYHPLVRAQYPLVTAALLAGASPQIRNLATNGGNLLQRTRCVYFYDVGVPCNKREPGSGCPARASLARQHAILGASEHCIATHPSDLCVALAALEAVVQVRSPRGTRSIAFADLHRLPGDHPEQDTTLYPDELIEHITLPPAQAFAGHSVYIKVRERASYAFALVSAAALLDLDEGGRVRAARMALGGVAHKPWRRAEAEALLVGRLAHSDSAGQAFARAAALLLDGAQAQGEGPGSNAFKIPMARRAMVRALHEAVRGTVSNTGPDNQESVR